MTRISERVAVVIILALALGGPIVGLSRPALYDNDEGTYAEVAREMLATGRWLLPHYDGAPYLEKPPLVLWAAAASMALFGQNERAARLPSAVFAILGVAALYALVLSYGRRREAAYAALCLGTSLGYSLYSRMLMMDVPLTALITVVFCALAAGRRRPSLMRPIMLLASAAIALAVMVKGVVGAAIPALTLGIVWIMRRHAIPFRRLPWLGAALGFLALVLPWHIIIEARYPGAFGYYVIGGQFARFLVNRAALDVVPASIPGYLGATAFWFAPWVLFLPAALWAAVRALREQPEESELVLLAVAWAVVAVGLFVFSPARLEYYSLPALPALAILLAHWWTRLEAPSFGTRAPFFAMLMVGSAGAAAALMYQRVDPSVMAGLLSLVDENYRDALAFARPTFLPQFNAFVTMAEINIVALMAAAVVGLYALSRGYKNTCVSLVALVGVVMSFSAHRGLQVFEPYYSSATLARRVASFSGNDDLAVLCPFQQVSALAFYTGQRVYVVGGCEEVAWPGRLAPQEGASFIGVEDLKRMWSSGRRIFLVAYDSGDAKARLPGIALHRIAEEPGRILFSNQPK